MSHAEFLAANPVGTPVAAAALRATATHELRRDAAEALVVALYLSHEKRIEHRVA